LVVLVAFASALLCSAILAGLQLWIYGIWFPGQGSPTGSTGFVLWTLFWFGYFLAWTGTFLALAYHREARLHEQQLANMRALAHEAQAAALRYQLNPHFLFNTINSVSAFVLERRPEEAERMLSNLSEFLRTTMSMDPSATVTLAEEVALQQAYLEIEKVRFSNRVHVEVDVPAQLADTEVPGLLLQPLVENAVRHGLGRCEAEVTLRIEAARDGEHVLIRVSDDAIGATRGGGTGIGLRNVRERLQAHYGDGARLTFGPLPGRGYSAEVRLPLSRRGNAGSFTAFEASL
jgi:LytS/YehU family sensor histidine kinase